MKKNKFLSLLIFSIFLASCSKGANELTINGYKSNNLKLNEIYKTSNSEEKKNNFITLVYQQDSIYSNFFIISNFVDSNSNDEIIVSPCILNNYEKNNIIDNNTTISESELSNGDILILYTINNETLSTYPVMYNVENMYKLDINISATLNYDNYLEK